MSMNFLNIPRLYSWCLLISHRNYPLHLYLDFHKDEEPDHREDPNENVHIKKETQQESLFTKGKSEVYVYRWVPYIPVLPSIYIFLL